MEEKTLQKVFEVLVEKIDDLRRTEKAWWDQRCEAKQEAEQLRKELHEKNLKISELEETIMYLKEKNDEES